MVTNRPFFDTQGGLTLDIAIDSNTIIPFIIIFAIFKLYRYTCGGG